MVNDETDLVPVKILLVNSKTRRCRSVLSRLKNTDFSVKTSVKISGCRFDNVFQCKTVVNGETESFGSRENSVGKY